MALLTKKKWNTFLILEFCLKEHGTFWTVSHFLGAEVYEQLRTILTNVLYYFDLFYNNWKRRIYLWLHYCKLCNRLFLNQQDRQQLAPSQIPNSESCKHTCRSFWQYGIALAYQGVFLPDITTYRHRCNWTSWTYHMCRGIKTYPTNVIF